MANSVKKFAAERKLAKRRSESAPEISNEDIFSALKFVNATIHADFKAAYTQISALKDQAEPEKLKVILLLIFAKNYRA